MHVQIYCVYIPFYFVFFDRQNHERLLQKCRVSSKSHPFWETLHFNSNCFIYIDNNSDRMCKNVSCELGLDPKIFGAFCISKNVGFQIFVFSARFVNITFSKPNNILLKKHVALLKVCQGGGSNIKMYVRKED